MYSLERKLEETQQLGQDAQAQLAAACGAADDFERKFLAERQQRRQVCNMCCIFSCAIVPNCLFEPRIHNM